MYEIVIAVTVLLGLYAAYKEQFIVAWMCLALALFSTQGNKIWQDHLNQNEPVKIDIYENGP